MAATMKAIKGRLVDLERAVLASAPVTTAGERDATDVNTNSIEARLRRVEHALTVLVEREEAVSEYLTTGECVTLPSYRNCPPPSISAVLYASL